MCYTKRELVSNADDDMFSSYWYFISYLWIPDWPCFAECYIMDSCGIIKFIFRKLICVESPREGWSLIRHNRFLVRLSHIKLWCSKHLFPLKLQWTWNPKRLSKHIVSFEILTRNKQKKSATGKEYQRSYQFPKQVLSLLRQVRWRL